MMEVEKIQTSFSCIFSEMKITKDLRIGGMRKNNKYVDWAILIFIQ